MTNTYKARTKAAEGVFFVGEGELELTIAEEQDWLANGYLEIVPRTYRVLTDTKVNGVSATDENPTFKAALPIETEAALMQGGHIERVDEKKAAPKKKTKEAKT